MAGDSSYSHQGIELKMRHDIIIERGLRKVTNTSKGRMRLSQEHIRKFIHNTSSEYQIGELRATKIRAWTATQVLLGNHSLRNIKSGYREWMSEGEGASYMVAALHYYSDNIPPSGNELVHRMEIVNSVRVWLEENEQLYDPKAQRPVRMLRPAKLRQLKAAKKDLLLRRGRVPAL